MGLDDIYSWMRSNNVAPEAIEAIEIGLAQLNDSNRGYDLNNELVLVQRELGWKALIFKIFYYQWREVQE